MASASPGQHDVGGVSRETTADEGAVRSALLARYPAGATLLPAYAEQLAGPGTARGLIGPREADRLWSRHLANSAVVADLCPAGARVIDVGSGAGLPGLPIALVRPDLTVELVEPLLRRSVFLTEVVEQLGLGERVTVRRARAEELASAGSGRRTTGGAERLAPADIVTARAVAPLGKLVGWCLNLVRVGGALLALKGERAEDEARSAARLITEAGGGPAQVLDCGGGDLPATRVVRIVRERVVR